MQERIWGQTWGKFVGHMWDCPEKEGLSSAR